MRRVVRSLAVAVLMVGAWAISSASAQGNADAAAFQKAFLAGQLTWDQVLQEAKKEGSVDWFYWGGDTNLNTWVDTVVATALQERGITLKSHRIPDTSQAVDLVLADQRSGRGIGQGSVDAVWINGENFRTLAEQNLLFGSFVDKLPNAKYFYLDPSTSQSSVNLSDFGYPTQMREVPWSGAQYTCYVDTARLAVADAPKTFADLESWLMQHPGRFTYSRPPNYIGNTFVEEVLYAHNPDGAAPFQKGASDYTAADYAKLVQPGFEYLRRIEPFLLGGGGKAGDRGSPVYPENDRANNALFTNGEVDMVCQFGIYGAAINIENGTFPQTVQNVVFPKGLMIKNKNFIGIPGNSPHPAAALVLANILASPENQISKLQTIGYSLGVDPTLLTAAEQQQIQKVAPSLEGISYQDLANNTAPDTNSSLVNINQTIWVNYIAQHSDKPFAQIVQEAFANNK